MVMGEGEADARGAAGSAVSACRSASWHAIGPVRPTPCALAAPFPTISWPNIDMTFVGATGKFIRLPPGVALVP